MAHDVNKAGLCRWVRRYLPVLGLAVVGVMSAPLAMAVPGTVTGVTATVISSQQINLSWTAVATATSYNIYRCSGSSSCTPSTTVYATSTTTTYSNTGLTSSTIYRYNLKAVDSSGGVSASFSSIVSGTTPAVAAPTGLSATAASSSQVNLSWTASTGVVTGYQVERCTGTSCTPAPPAIGTPTTNSYSNTGLLSSTAYRYRVRAVDAANNLSAYTSVVGATTPAVGTPTALSATATSSSQVNLTWTASTGTIAGYQVERCTGTTCTPAPPAVGTPTSNSFSNTGLISSTSYRYRVRAVDAASNASAYTLVVGATTPAVSAPSGLSASAVSSSQINLGWTASSGTISSYQVERCTPSTCTPAPPAIASPTSNSYSNTGLAASTGYSYRVRAVDAANNFSAYTSVASATTAAVGAPSALSATSASSSQINLNWTASTGAVSGYRVERCAGVGCATFAQVGTPTATTYGDTGLTASTSYSYRVRAADAGGNLSSYSNTATAATAAATSIYTYDTNGHLSTVATGTTTVTYSYDAAGNVTGIQTTP